MFFLKKNLDVSNLLFSKKIRNAIFLYNLKLNKKHTQSGRKYLRRIAPFIESKFSLKKIPKETNKKKENEILKKRIKENYLKELLCQLKKKSQIKRHRFFRKLVVRSTEQMKLKDKSVSIYNKGKQTPFQKRNELRRKKRLKKMAMLRRRRLWIQPKYKDPEFVDSLINLLKIKTKFQYVRKSGFKYCKLFFKYTGSNFFGTITDTKGNVFFSYSSGVFSGLNTRKEKTTIFVVKQLGQLLSLRLYKSNAREIIFIPLINHRKIKTFLRFLLYGVREMKMMHFVKIIPKRKIMRNGVRLKKVARK